MTYEGVGKPEITLDVEEFSAVVVVNGHGYASAWGPLIDNGDWAVVGDGRSVHRVPGRDAALAELRTIYDKAKATYAFGGSDV